MDEEVGWDLKLPRFLACHPLASRKRRTVVIFYNLFLAVACAQFGHEATHIKMISVFLTRWLCFTQIG